MSGVQQWVALRIADTEYALPITMVQEVIRYMQPAPTGGPGDECTGVIDLRGRVVPVSNLAARLGGPCRETAPQALDPTTSKIVIVDTGGAWHGLIVDQVDEVLTIAPGDVHDAPESAGGHLGGVATIDSRIVLLLDVSRVLELAPPSAAAA